VRVSTHTSSASRGSRAPSSLRTLSLAAVVALAAPELLAQTPETAPAPKPADPAAATAPAAAVAPVATPEPAKDKGVRVAQPDPVDAEIVPEEEDLEGLGDEAEVMPPRGYVPGHSEHIGIGLSPHVPTDHSILPGGLTPRFGSPLRPADGAKFDFTGYMQGGIRVFMGQRRETYEHQSSTTMHGNPNVPGVFGAFESTNTVPYPWAQLNFSYGTAKVSATATLAAWGFGEAQRASGWIQSAAQVWFKNAFLTYKPDQIGPFKLEAKVGAFNDVYGAMAEYHDGPFGSPLVGVIFGVGETLSASVNLSEGLDLELEHGVKGQFGRTPLGIGPGWPNEWARDFEGATYAHHAHVGIDIAGIARPTVHYIAAIARDDLSDGVRPYPLNDPAVDGQPNLRPRLNEDGHMQILAVDSRFQFRRFGFLYAGWSRTQLVNALALSNLIRVQSSGSGKDLMEQHIGVESGGDGTLDNFGLGYTVSLGTLLRYPEEFYGEGPDLLVNVFGQFGHVASDDPAYDGIDRYKFGVEATYVMLPWLSGATRIDRAVPDTGFDGRSFTVTTLKAIFRSDWQARESLVLQYSKWFNGADVALQGDRLSGGVSPLISRESNNPDDHLVALYGTFWW
jgi:hypothetical protein